MRRGIIWRAGILFFLGSFLSVALAADFTADTITKSGRKTANGKVWVKGDKWRVEKANTPLYWIGRGDKGVFWEINGVERTYLEGKLTLEAWPKVTEKLAGETSRKQMGQETVDGHPARKFEVAAREGNKTQTYHQWIATDLKIPVKLAKPDGSWSFELKNIRKGAPDNAFDLPAGMERDRTAPPELQH